MVQTNGNTRTPERRIRTRRHRTASKVPDPKPKVAVFSRENPCTKLEIWNLFRGRRGFMSRTVEDALSQIGENAPRYMERMARVKKFERNGKTYMALTESGEEWLTQGFRNYLRNHPGDLVRAKNVPRALMPESK